MERTQPMQAAKKPKKWLFYPLGFAVGILNGFFGAGGGMIAVPMLQGMGLDSRESHATSMAVILPLAVASGLLYLKAGQFALSDAAPYLPVGLAGALVGAWLLPKIGTLWLRRIFGAVIIFSAVRMILR